ncbi:MAG: hypothetical protein H3C31_07675 [Brumimicrobium sp.]|nr:hypothetical protein [Brumimicrobium sp.]
MIAILKNNWVSFLFFIGIIAIHYGIASINSHLYFGKELILAYTTLLFVEGIRIALFTSLKNKKLKIDFVQTFMVFTTIQLIACIAFTVFIKIKYSDLSKAILIQFVILFGITLIYQVFVIKRLSKELTQ